MFEKQMKCILYSFEQINLNDTNHILVYSGRVI